MAGAAAPAIALRWTEEERALADAHRVGGRAVVPAALLLAKLRAVLGQERAAAAFEGVELLRPIGADALGRDGAVRCAVADPGFALDIEGEPAMRGRAGAAAGPVRAEPPTRDEPAEGAEAAEAFYADAARAGNGFGASLRLIEARGGDAAHGWARIGRGSAPAMLDACFHGALALAPGGAEGGWVIASIDRVELASAWPGRLWCRYRVRGASAAGTLVVDVEAIGADGAVAARVEGLAFRRTEAGDGAVIHVAGNVALDPLAEAVAALGGALGIAAQCAPYDHVLQCLGGFAGAPGPAARSLALVVALERWRPPCAPPRLRPPGTDLATVGGREVVGVQRYETVYLYEEIFDRGDYLPPWFDLPRDAVVIDVGANIGMFALFALAEAPDARLYAFEPSPVTARACAANLAAYPGATVLQKGAGAASTRARFVHYRGASVFSGFHAAPAADAAALGAILRNEIAEAAQGDAAAAAAFASEIAQSRLEAEEADVEIMPLSELIAKEGLERIDLLKIDAERSEADVLRGIAEADWPRIRQIVIETHDDEGEDSRWIRALLRARGFVLREATDPSLRGSGLSLLYAHRPAAADQDAPQRPRRNPDPLGLDPRIAELAAALEGFRARSALPVQLILAPPAGASARSAYVRRALEAAAARLAARCSAIADVAVCLPEEIEALWPGAGAGAAEPDGAREEAGLLHSDAWYAAAAALLLRRHAARHRLPHKVIAVDADNTLWRGACAELGPDGVTLDAPALALQHRLLALKQAGLLLALVSKNIPEDVEAVFAARSDMPLRRADFAAVRIGWEPKSAGIAAIADELGLATDSILFIDDNEVECAEVKAALGAVLTLRYPAEPAAAARLLAHHWALDPPPAGAGTPDRTEGVRQERLRAEARQAAGSFADFLASLALEVEIAPPAPGDLPRLAELTRRTNQFNLDPAGASEAQLQAEMETPGRVTWKVRARDRFGDYGIVGLLAGAAEGGALRIDRFLLSCRALGRGVEQQMLAAAADAAEAAGLAQIELAVRSTARNVPARAFVAVAAGAQWPGDGPARVPVDAALRARLRDPAAWIAREPAAAVEPAAQPDRRLAPIDLLYRDAQWLEQQMARTADLATLCAAIWPQAEDAPPPEFPDASATERMVAAAWSRVLGRPLASLDADFFAIGGSSLRLVRLLGDLHRQGARLLRLGEAYAAPTARAMAAALDRPAADADERRVGAMRAEVPAAGVDGHGPAVRALSAPEQAIWFEQLRDPRSAVYATSVPLLIDGPWDLEAIRRAWQATCAAHPLLRTIYRLDGRLSLAETRAAPHVPFRRLEGVAWTPAEALAYARRRAGDPMDLAKGTVTLDAGPLADGRRLVLIRIHHIAADLHGIALTLATFGAELGGRRTHGDCGGEGAGLSYADFARRVPAPPRGSGGARSGPGAAPWWAAYADRPQADAGAAGAAALRRLPGPVVRALHARVAAEGVSPLVLLLTLAARFARAAGAGAEPRFATPVSLRPSMADGAAADFVGNCVALAVPDLAGRDTPAAVRAAFADAADAAGRVPAAPFDTSLAWHEGGETVPVSALLADGELSAPFSFGGGSARFIGLAPQAGLAPIGFDLFAETDALVLVAKGRAGLFSAAALDRIAGALAAHVEAALIPPAEPVAVPGPVVRA